ncbi:tetratricopeptide repeat protein, partial [Teredinibacter turnerae]|uniref:tetratricopeptide repeat protein n=1 Tax=Teredinibacter turnerae TaxID=2426 RepID=UPI0004755714
GDYETALSYLKQSLAIQQEIGYRSGEGATLNNMCGIAYAKGDYETALCYLKQSLAIRQEIGDVAGLCAALFNMGHIYFQNEQGSEAINAWLSVYRLAKPMQLAQVLEALGRLAETLGLNEQLGVESGLSAWEVLLEQQEQRAQEP